MPVLDVKVKNIGKSETIFLFIFHDYKIIPKNLPGSTVGNVDLAKY
jgi:hypothetical protein